MSDDQLHSQPPADLDVESAFTWYEGQRPGLGSQFLAELSATFERVLDGPFMYEELRAGVRHAALRRFPYAVFFLVDGERIVVLAVLHTHRNPSEWQRRLE